MKVAVIGGVAAGLTAASRIKKEDKNAKVVVFEKSGDLSYGACGMPYNIALKEMPPEKLYALDYDTITNKRKIDYRLYSEVYEININRSEVAIYDHKNKKDYKYSYDYLVCATGAKQNELQISGFDSDVFYFKNLDHLRALKQFIYENNPKKACLVGAGYINLELAENLAAIGIDVTIIEKTTTILPFLENECRKYVFDYLTNKNIKIHTDTDIYEKDGKMLKTDKGDFKADFIVVAVGVSPDTKLFGAAGIETGIKNAVKVDHNLKTNVENIFAAGDCAEHYVPLLNQWTYMPLGTTANKMGRIAGHNIANPDNMQAFYGINQSSAFRIFDISVATTGLFESQLIDNGFHYGKTVITTPDRPAYMGGDTQKVCLLYEKTTGKILGCQIVGHGTVAKRADIISTAINAGMMLEEFANADLTYAPPFANVWDSLLVATNVAIKHL